MNMEVLMANEKLSVLLREARLAHGYTEQGLGELLGVSHAAISHWESGKQVPQDRQLRRLSEIFELALDQMVSMAQEERCQREFRKLKAKYRRKYTTVLLRQAAKELNKD